jgi:hypothetical protein
MLEGACSHNIRMVVRSHLIDIDIGTEQPEISDRKGAQSAPSDSRHWPVVSSETRET